MGDARTSVRKTAQTVDRQLRAMRLYVEGRTYQEIADDIGYADHTGARKAVLAGLEVIKAEHAEAAGHARSVILERLELLLRAHLPRATAAVSYDQDSGDEVWDTKSADIVLKTIDRVINLHGLNQPTQVEVTAEGGSAARVQSMLAAFADAADARGITVEADGPAAD